jgi:hypothetical protein
MPLKTKREPHDFSRDPFTGCDGEASGGELIPAFRQIKLSAINRRLVD